MSIKERLLSKVQKTDKCWNWTASKDRYGHFNVGGKILAAHRVSWEVHRGKIPSGMKVLHRCDNPICVNPDHLFLGTQRDNIADMDSKGRRAVGESVHTSKMNAEKVIELRRLHKIGFSTRELGKKYGITPHQVCVIARGKHWRAVK